MKTKATLITILTIAAATLAGCQEPKILFKVRVTDDEGKPMEHCEVLGTVFDHWEPGPESGKDKFRISRVMTDENGIALINSSSKRKDAYYSATPPPGFYITHRAEFSFREVLDGQWTPADKQFEVVLKRKRNPIAMYAKNLTSEGGDALKIPARDLAFAYDFVIGDWIPPHGKGVNGDIVFQYSFQKEASGDSRRVIRITFTNPQDGLVIFDADQWHGSELTSDYLAPESGYKPLFEMKRTIVKGVVTDERRPERNYYFRVRTKVNSEGKIVSANYGKIYGDFMYFTYYFNPIPNDRNVEFDPAKNLFRDVPNLLKVERP